MSSTPLQLEATAYGEGTGWRRGIHMVDALPYIDTLTEKQKRQVDALLEEEMVNSTKTPADYLNELPPLPESTLQEHPILQAELERVARKEAMPPIDVTRYRLDGPAANKRNDQGQWQAALDNAHSQLEHQYNRMLNLELAVKYGPNAWRANNEALDAESKRLEAALEKVKADTEALNQQRKLLQMTAKGELQALEAEWRTTVKKNVEIQKACAQLEQTIQRMQAPAPNGST